MSPLAQILVTCSLFLPGILGAFSKYEIFQGEQVYRRPSGAWCWIPSANISTAPECTGNETGDIEAIVSTHLANGAGFSIAYYNGNDTYLGGAAWSVQNPLGSELIYLCTSGAVADFPRGTKCRQVLGDNDLGEGGAHVRFCTSPLVPLQVTDGCIERPASARSAQASTVATASLGATLTQAIVAFVLVSSFTAVIRYGRLIRQAVAKCFSANQFEGGVIEMGLYRPRGVALVEADPWLASIETKQSMAFSQHISLAVSSPPKSVAWAAALGDPKKGDKLCTCSLCTRSSSHESDERAVGQHP